MSEIKANMDTTTAKMFLCDYYKSDIADVQAIEQGELSRAYYFRHQGADYVIRFNNRGDGFVKERLLLDMFSSKLIPMPRIVDIGRREELHFCISERAPGKPLIVMPLDQIQAVLPDLLHHFLQLQRVELEGTQGYGILNDTGNGTCKSWADFLESFFEDPETGFWYGWKQLFEGGMLERDVFEYWYSRMIELAAYVPTERYLVHGDFHVGNIVSDGSRITGIVDWEMSMYGDFLFDVATIHMWTPQLQFPQLFRDFATAEGVCFDHFEQRLQCAYLFKSLDGLRFYAKKNDRGAYEHMKQFMERMAAV